MKRISFLLTALACLLTAAQAKVVLPSILGNDMVLQRNTEVNLWGEAEPNKKVTITASWTKEKFSAKADKDGKWATKIPTGEAGGPYTMTFSDGDKTELTNILLGEVWIASGQSNMEMPVGGYMYQPIDGVEQDIAEAYEYPNIRMFTVPRCISDTPKEDCDTIWRTSDPMTVRTFSAIAYLFAKELNKMLDVPVGIVTSNWGGTIIEAWMSKESINAIEGRNAAYDARRKNENAHAALYNGMIRPICNFTAKGFIWYQGESNRHNWYDYVKLQQAQVKLWREIWGNDKMPFYITQIAPYCYEGPKKRLNALFIDQQYKAAELIENCDVACSQDAGDYSHIHPLKKKRVAWRLAMLALDNDYGIKGLPSKAPRFNYFIAKGNKLELHFKNIAPPYTTDPLDYRMSSCFYGREEAKGFEVAGEDGKFFPAKGNHCWWTNIIEVWSDSVPNPVAVRYAYCNYSFDANVRTQLGQALPSFRSDQWEIKDEELK